MIKTSGYRVSPTEVEEVLYATQLVGECAALRRRRTRRWARRSWSSPRRRDGADARRRRAAGRMPRAHAGLHGAGRHRGPRRPAAAQPERQDRPQAAAPPGVRRTLLKRRRPMNAASARARADGPVRRRRRRAAASAAIAAHRAGRARRPDAVLRLRPRGCCAQRVAELRAALPPGVKLHYAMKANPMPARGRLHGRPGGRHRRGLGGRAEGGARRRRAIRHEISFAGPGKTRRRAARRRWPPASWSTSSRCARCDVLAAISQRARAAGARRGARQPGLRAQGARA